MSGLTPAFQNLTISDDKLLFSESKLTVEQQALASQWITLVSSIQQSPEFLTKLNEALRHSTYILGNVPTNCDVVVFKSVFPILESAGDQLKDDQYISDNRHILRWIDLIQNTLVKLTDSEKLKIPYDANIPTEVQAKPKKDAKKADAAKDAAPKKDAAAAASGNPNKPKGKPSPEELAKLKEEKAKQKAAKKAAAQQSAPVAKTETVAANPGQVDLRVGFIEKAIKHPDADSLYVSTMNVGEENPRTICSGLVKHYLLEEMQQRHVVVVCNLKKVKMRGIDSLGMVLCCSNESGVQFVNPPAGSKPGDKVFFEGFDAQPEKVLNPKKKIWETVQPKLTTSDDFTVIYKGDDGKVSRLVNKRGEAFKCTNIVNAHVS